MFKTLKKTALCEFTLNAEGPVLIGSKNTSQTDPTKPDASFLMSGTENGEAYVIPGSTIKGVLRSRFEELFGKSAASGLFGGIRGEPPHRSKISFHDAYADMDTVVLNIRRNTAIDSAVQAPVRASLNDAQVVEKGVFAAGFRCVNFTDEEMSRLLSVLNEINIGLIRFGAGKSRGFGLMTLKDFRMTVRSFGKSLEGEEVSLPSLDEAMEYYGKGERR